MDKLNLLERRDFGKNLDMSVKFFKQNFVEIMKTVSFILLIPIAGAWLMADIPTIDPAGMEDIISGDYEAILDYFPAGFFFGLLLAVIASFLVMTYVISYMKVYVESETKAVDSTLAWSKCRSSLLPLFIIAIVYTVVMIIGLVLCILPGIFIAIAACLYGYVYVNEKTSLVGSISRSMTLTKGNWWMTFGYVLVIGILISIIQTLMDIPSVLHTTGVITNFAFKFITKAISMSVAMLLSIFTYVAYGVYYYSLRDESEGLTMLNRIDEIGEENNDN